MKNRILIFLMVLFSGLAACPPPAADGSTSEENQTKPSEPFDPLTELLPVGLYYGLLRPLTAVCGRAESLRLYF